MPSPPRRQGGFTFLWLLFLIAGLGVGMAAVGTLWHTAAQREKEKQLLFVGNEYRRAIESFLKIPLPAGQQARLPQSLDELLLDPRFQHTVRHLRRLYTDPITGNNEWGLLKDAKGGIGGVFSLSELTPFKKQNFPSAYEDFVDKSEYRQWVFATIETAAPVTTGVTTAAEAEKNTVTKAAENVDESSVSQTGRSVGPSDVSDTSNRQRALCINEWRQDQYMKCKPYQKAKQWTLYQSCLTDVYHRFQDCLAGD